MTGLKDLMAGPPPLTLAVAESLTCGRLQALIGSISGASNFFQGGITAYTLDQKVRHLGVDRGHASAVDSVSALVAEQMARGACSLFGADVGAATTGYAEPAPAWNVREPFAWWGLAFRRPDGVFQVRSFRIDCPAVSRAKVQERVAETAYAGLLEWIASLRAKPSQL